MITSADVRIGTSGWSIPRAAAFRFDATRTHLERYARRLRCAEINSSFYRSHTEATYSKWRDSTPPDFMFAVKLPRMITHDLRLKNAGEALTAFLVQSAGLRHKRGPILVQLPPSLVFDAAVVTRFLEDLRMQRGSRRRWTRSWIAVGFRAWVPIRHLCRQRRHRQAGRDSHICGFTGRHDSTGQGTRRNTSMPWRLLRGTSQAPLRSGVYSTTRPAVQPSKMLSSCASDCRASMAAHVKVGRFAPDVAAGATGRHHGTAHAFCSCERVALDDRREGSGFQRILVCWTLLDASGDPLRCEFGRGPSGPEVRCVRGRHDVVRTASVNEYSEAAVIASRWQAAYVERSRLREMPPESRSEERPMTILERRARKRVGGDLRRVSD